MARIALVDVNQTRYVSTDQDGNTEEAVMKFADFIARIQTDPRFYAESALEFTTDEGTVYIMPNHVVVLARVED